MKNNVIKRAFLLVLCLTLFISCLSFGASAAASTVEYYLSDGWYNEAQINREIIETMDSMIAQGGDLTMDVRDLAEETCYEIYAYGAGDTFLEVHGAVYIISDSYYYLNYPSLGNAHFDADGNFSYRSGEVTLKNVDAFKAPITAAIVQVTSEVVIETTSDTVHTGELAAVFFWVGFALLGFIAPIPFLVLGILLSRSKRMGCPKYWLILSCIAAAWIILSVLLLLLLLIA